MEHATLFNIRTFALIAFKETLKWLISNNLQCNRNKRSLLSVDRALPQPIEVQVVEFYCKDNAKAHHTENYDILEGKDPSPVFRRGEYFFVAFRFNRVFNVQTDKVRIHLMFGKYSLKNISIYRPS